MNQGYLCGDNLTAADIVLAPVLIEVSHLKDILTDDYKSVHDYLKNINGMSEF